MNSRYRRERRQPPYYLITGLVLGFLLGYLFTAKIFPVQYTNVPPETLNLTDKDQYRLLIAMAFQANQDMGRAQARLGLLREASAVDELIAHAGRTEKRNDAQILLNLADALKGTTNGSQTPSVTPAPTENAPTITPSPSLTLSITPETTLAQAVRTATPPSEGTSPTSAPPVTVATALPTSLNILFRLEENRTVCNPLYGEPLLQVEVISAEDDPLPNIRILVTWQGGQNIFFSGYYPEISAGYADFTMTPNTTYSLKVGEAGEQIQNLSAPQCTDDAGNPYWGSIYLRFNEP